MKTIRAEIIKLLQADATLIAMLPSNPCWFDEDQPDSKQWSILPVDRVTPGLLKPIVTYQAGPDNLIGTNLLEDFFYIRCYNASDKTFVSIDDVLSRVKVLLHRHRFTFTDGTVSIDTVYESTGAELMDEGFALPFRESRYRLLRI